MITKENIQLLLKGIEDGVEPHKYPKDEILFDLARYSNNPTQLNEEVLLDHVAYLTAFYQLGKEEADRLMEETSDNNYELHKKFLKQQTLKRLDKMLKEN